MAAKKKAVKKTAKKSIAKRAGTSAKKTAKKVTSSGKSLAKRATSAASGVARKTKQVAQGAQKVGKVIEVIGTVVESGVKAAEDLTAKVGSAGRGALPKSKKSSASKSGARKKR
jgi:hypothetical protein